ncbi:acyl-CoA dehydrogenase family protein [Sphingomonas flavalba]|uniref:acyl-CoA dehydrogenase family protein n=1 Tax=Sphingomonas flavalba TaxID=2559804 RepID=UPI0039E05908
MDQEHMLAATRAALKAADRYAGEAQGAARALIMREGRIDPVLLIERQRAVHGYAWIATVVAALHALHGWADRITRSGALRDIDLAVLQIGFGEYLAQLGTAIPMSQTEFVRPLDLGIAQAAAVLAGDDAVTTLIAIGNQPQRRKALVDRAVGGEMPSETLDETLDMIRDQFRGFVRARIAPNAHEWHLADDLIPDAIVAEMGDLGVFGVCIDPEYGGLGLGKLALCVVSEELSRGWIAAGSLGTRSEIAGELIAHSGTEAQKRQWLPGIASGRILPTAVFTEPDIGSDLAALKTRAIETEGGHWRITGAKNWITHAARSDLMTVLARTEPDQPGHNGLSMFLAAKARRQDGADFPDDGLEGSEIKVLGYRGMREYALSFDDFPVAPEALLGGTRGLGFRQLMRTFESARIQTAARAVGVAWNTVDCALRYALDRRQFGKKLADFPRISDKLALMIVETVIARELSYASARQKDKGERCDIEAGMAKLLGARVAWSNADQCLQIHGGNGYALEYEASRLLCDARILSIFEGAAEIQAQVIARGLIA